MKGKEVYNFKSICNGVCSCCHNTKNRVIDMMCNCHENHKNHLAKYLKCLMTLESLCNYLCTCCCEMEEISSHGIKEYEAKCKKICSCCDKLESHLSKKEFEYINCHKIKKLCNK